jgi:hypothetical protein
MSSDLLITTLTESELLAVPNLSPSLLRRLSERIVLVISMAAAFGILLDHLALQMYL